MVRDSNWRDREDRQYRSDYRSDRYDSQAAQFSGNDFGRDYDTQMGEGSDRGFPAMRRGGTQVDMNRDQTRGSYDYDRDYTRGMNDRNAAYGRNSDDYGYGRNQRGSADHDAQRRRASRGSAFGPASDDGMGGRFGSFNSQDYGGRDFQSGNQRVYSGADTSYSAGGYGRSYNDQGFSPKGYDYEERGFFERAGDEVASWFGDDDAARRRRMDERQDHRGRGPANYNRSDERVLEDACDALTRDRGVDASDIQVSVQDGEVTLDGLVDDRRAKRRAEDCVHDVSGVNHVQNNLRMRGRDRSTTAGSVDRTDNVKAS